MDSGLGVRWPLSPYATALAAGALFAFCLALWRHRAGAKKRRGKDPSGQAFGRDLDPKQERDACGAEKSEPDAEKQRNFPVLAFADLARGFNYEHLCTPGRFGAVPRSSQRNQALEYPNLYSVFRRKKVRKEEEKAWQGVSSTSSNFSCIYQQPFCFTNELPRLNARFLLNLSPHLQPYIRRFGDFQVSELSQPNDFENFDVALKPEILKNKPITRSAVCLALDRQLHKFLEEPFREVKSNERAIQTAEITEDDDETGASGDSNLRIAHLDSDSRARGKERLENNQCDKRASSELSLWDSGYGEKAFEDRCSTPKEFKDSDNVLIEEYDEYSDDISQTLNIEVTQSTEIKECVVTEVDDSNFLDEKCDRVNNVLTEESLILSVTEQTIHCENLNIIKYSDILKQTCDDIPSKSDNGDGEFDTASQGKKHDSVVLEASDSLTESRSKEKISISNEYNSSEASRTNQSIKVSEEIQGHVHRDTFSEFSVEHVIELDVQVDTSSSNAEEIREQTKNFNFEDNVNASQINKCSDKEFESYRGEIRASSSEENIYYLDMENNSDVRSDNETETLVSSNDTENSVIFEVEQRIENSSFPALDLEPVQRTIGSSAEARQEESGDENLFRTFEIPNKEKNDLSASTTCIHQVDAGGERVEHSIECSTTASLEESDLEGIQSELSYAEEQNHIARLSVMLETKRSEKRNSRPVETAAASPSYDVTAEGSSRDSGSAFDERGTFNSPRQMDRETGERSVAVESTVTTETTLRANGDARLSTAVVSRLTLEDWSAGAHARDSVSVKTTVSDEIFRPTFEEFVALKSGEKTPQSDREETFDDDPIPLSSRNGRELQKSLSSGDLPSSPRADRLKGLLSRDEQRRSRTKFHHLADASHVGGAMEGEWDRLLRDVLASVSELERWERRQCDVSSDAEDAEQRQHPLSQSDSSFTMEEEAPSPKEETPTKVKSLRFKLDPDVFDVPSDDSFYDDDNNNDGTRRGWKKQPKYRAFSSLELEDEPVRLVSVHASVVPAGQKMVARPVGIDLRVRLTEERQSKRAHVSTSPSQAKRRSPVSDRGIGWCQELSPVTENVDWRDTFTPVTPECKPVPNGILKTPSPKIDPCPVESPNPFKLENGVVVTNGVSQATTEKKSAEKAKYNGWKPPIERKPFLIIRKKFEPDPEAIERITGYKSALSKPPLPPPLPHKGGSNLSLRNRAELARKQYLDNKAALANSKVDGTKKFQQFLSQAQSDRARIVTSVPDLVAIERAVTEQWTKERQSVSPRESPGREENNRKPDSVTASRGSTPDDKWASYVQSCRQHLGRRSQSMTYLETDIDIIPVLDDDDKCHSTSALDEPDEALPDPDDSDLDESREDLDDSGRAKSEHELRIERSLRSLPLPEWYRRSDKTKTGFLLGSSNKEKRGWAAAKSLASSTSSLASCGLRRPVRSLRSSRENIPWSRSSASPDGQTLSLALAKAFREPYLGWRARTPTSSGVSSSPRASPPSWNATTTDDEANGVSFDGEDAFGRTTTTSSEDDKKDEPLSLDDTGADAVTVSMDTNDPVKLPGGEDTCDDINNMSMDTCELFDASVVVPVDEDPSPQADTGDDIDNLSTDTTTTEGRKLDPKLKRYSYSQSIYHSEWDEEEESRGDKKSKEENREQSPGSPDHKVVWIESSFVGSRTTTSIVVLPEKKTRGSSQERPASR